MSLRAIFQKGLTTTTNRLATTGARRTTMASPFLISINSSSPTAIMTTITTRTFASKKHKLLLKHAKGYRGRSKNCFRIAIRRIEKAWQYAYRDRKTQRRNWRKLWIQRLQAGVRQYQWSYSRFIPALKSCDIHLNRKVLSELAATEPFAFKAVVDVVNEEHNNHVKQQRATA